MYDLRCKELAEHFLQEHIKDEDYCQMVDYLARAIQSAIEDWLTDKYPTE